METQEVKEEEIVVDAVVQKPDLIACEQCEKMIYNGELCSCKVKKHKHDK